MRHLFFLCCLSIFCTHAQETQKIELKQHQVCLDGTKNLRDLGGLETSTGQKIRKNILFRSDKLSDLSDADLEKLVQKKLTAVIDLRSKIEIEKKPDRLPKTVHSYHRQLGTHQSKSEFLEKLLSGHWTPQTLKKFFIENNKKMLKENAETFAQVIQDIIDNDSGATLFHCAGGQDRAGVTAAVVLSLLQVPKDTIVQEYMLTKEQKQQSFVNKKAKLQQQAPQLDDAVLDMLQAQPEYMESVLESIDKDYGGVVQYAKDQLKLDMKVIQQLRDKLLETP